MLLVRQPGIPSGFRVYDTPVEVLHAVGEQRSESMENVRVTDAHTNEDTGLSHVYVRQTASGVDVLNGLANINIDKYGRAISSSQAFAPIDQVQKTIRPGRLVSSTDQYASLKAALKSLSKHLKTEIDDEAINRLHISKMESDGTHFPKFIVEGVPTNVAVDGTVIAYQAMMQRSDGSLVHVWDIVLKQADHWWNARVNMVTGGVESLADWVLRSGINGQRHGVVNDGDALQDRKKHAKRQSYYALPITRVDPREGLELIVKPETESSPNGWVSSDTTVGNNVWAQSNPSGGDSWENNFRPRESSPGTFSYDADFDKEPATYINASIVQLFYAVNALHDIFYLYGFTEATFNFQDDNFGRGGQGGDSVVAFAQDGGSQLEASYGSFAAPPDGQHGVLRSRIVSDANRKSRDSSFEVDIVSHLYTLGVSNRLVGGGSAACLQSRTSSGLQFGYADAFADWLAQTSHVPDFTIGQYISGLPIGLRSHPYSRDSIVNPLTYADGPPSAEIDAIREVWANMLHNVLAALADNRGWSDTALIDSAGDLGNVVFMHLLMDSLSIAPCEPTLITARDAIIQADQDRYGGNHYCILWQVFASRGLGFGAAEDNINEYSVPPGC
ncbi:hypothetical protein V502_00406 [Pseudogymnoascus sp. VKM F-4520 (FW-2644)]|nr:hypothetical protein V502_00406 [Pseudogymnoascus sp. VKM F-4520 (FW-2644)]